MFNDKTFFTNESELDLYSRFCNILKSNTQFFDILVGYFRVSGFYNLYLAMKDIEKIRILIGINIDKMTFELIKESRNISDVTELNIDEKKRSLSSVIEKEIINSEDTIDIEESINTFIEWLKIGKLDIRMYDKDVVHAKVYIMRKNPELSLDYMGSVITGSSNFSYAGLKNNLEFNVELRDSRDISFALDYFEKLWNNSVDVNYIFIQTILEKTWIKKDITPYQLYLKTLYEYFKDEINQDKEENSDIMLPVGYMRLQYQIDAVIQAKRILDTYNGVFISDVVGLGKTYIAAMLASSLPKGKKLIICPPVLVDYWKRVLLEFDVAATVESLGKLDRLIEKNIDYKYVFIDEAHRFRNQDTQSFTLLHQICFNKKIILISATPLNNYITDIENQIYLFQPKHNSTIIPNEKNIEAFFNKLNSNLSKLEKGTPAYMNILRKNSEIIRDKVLRHIMIRRTRKEIVEFYAEDLKCQNLSFPKLGKPEPIIYEFDEKVNEIFNITIKAIKDFKYARYTPLLYLNNKKEYGIWLTAQKNMGGFIKTILIKRLESSFYAFKMTLSRFINSYIHFIDMYKKGSIYISKRINIYDLLDTGNIEKLFDLINKGDVLEFKCTEFQKTLEKDLQEDLKTLRFLKSLWDSIEIDPKLKKIKDEIKYNKIINGNKVIIFTESQETAIYLGENLNDLYNGRVVVFSGKSNNLLKQEIEDSFNPANQKNNNDKYDLLITTDVLSEGINLHRTNILINYDLPWNPTRVMQRVGRINRVGTNFDKIYVFNFFPTAESNSEIPLRDRILEKIQAFHDTLGEDFKYISDEEQISSQKLFETLTGDLDENETSINPELHYLNEIRKIRDNDIELFDKIKKLPLKAKCCKIVKNKANMS
ncbi:MAG TPA: helicase, partial [Candidatus Megamonas gallistercoris]|nr:helicase [Candidatus Megamonas gallistercoris]